MENKYLIVFDGLDGAGKHTQANKLAEYFDNVGIKYKLISFPVYETPSGELVKKFLKGEIQMSDENDTMGLGKIRHSLIYTVDRCLNMTKEDENGKSLMDYYDMGYVIICDRYVSSNFIFMTDDTNDIKFDIYVSAMEMIEYCLCGLPKPTVSFFLEMPPEKSMECIEKRSNEKDVNENLYKLTKAYESLNRYKNKCIGDADKYFINCVSNSGDIRTIDDIHEEIKKIVLNTIYNI